MSTEPFESLPDVLDVTLLAEALHLSKAGAYNLLNGPDFPTLHIGGRKLVMAKSIAQLRQELADNEKKIAQEQHKLQRLDNRIRYCEDGERAARTHRLITRGAAVESVVPELRDLSETEFYTLAEHIFSLPDVKSAVFFAVTEHQKRVQRGG